jgi:hypothetical protein
MVEADFGRVITKKETTVGTAYIFDLIPSMWAVIVFDANSQIILSRNFPYNELTEKEMFATCKTFYKKVKDALLKKDVDALEEML